MRQRAVRLWTTGTILLAAGLLLGACGGGSKASALKGKITVPASNQVVTTTSGPAATAPATTTAPTGTVSLSVTSSVYSALLQAWISWAASNHVAQIMPSDVTSPAPGSVFYASDGPTKTSWAIAMFTLSSSGQRLLAPGATPDNANALTDGGQRPTFTMKPGSPWTVVDASAGPPCGIPQAVLKVWSFPFGSSVCAAATAPTTTPPPTPPAGLAAIAGNYEGSTGSSGALFIRSDGASRFTDVDLTACPSCSTASAPEATVDFSLKTITATGPPGSYRATGLITAESDPADARTFAGPVGATVVVTAYPPNTLTDAAPQYPALRISFLPDNDVLTKL